MSQNESTPFLVTDAKNLTLIDANRENSPWWEGLETHFIVPLRLTLNNSINNQYSVTIL